MPVLQLLINLPFLFLGWLIKYLFFYRKGFSKEFLQGTKEAFHCLNNIDKVKYKNKNLNKYFTIQLMMIKSTFNYIFFKLIHFVGIN
jgi:hypothetical protein